GNAMPTGVEDALDSSWTPMANVQSLERTRPSAGPQFEWMGPGHGGGLNATISRPRPSPRGSGHHPHDVARPVVDDADPLERLAGLPDALREAHGVGVGERPLEHPLLAVLRRDDVERVVWVVLRHGQVSFIAEGWRPAWGP